MVHTSEEGEQVSAEVEKNGAYKILVAVNVVRN